MLLTDFVNHRLKAILDINEVAFSFCPRLRIHDLPSYQ